MKNNLSLILIFVTEKGGSLFFGIDTRGCVDGIVITRNERDEFRLGVDREMGWMHPCVLHDLFEVKYHPVVKVTSSNDATMRTLIEDTYVIGKSLHKIHTFSRLCLSLYIIICVCMRAFTCVDIFVSVTSFKINSFYHLKSSLLFFFLFTEIEIKATSSHIYRTRDNVCFFRDGHKTIQVRTQVMYLQVEHVLL